MSEAHSTITNVDEEIPSYLKTAITRPIKGSCDTNRNLRDPTKALAGFENFKLRDRLQNKNSEPKSSALAPIKNNQSQKSRLWLQKK